MKTSFIKFRCTNYEKKLLKIKAKKAGLNLSQYCRNSAFEKVIIERLTKEQIEFYKMFVDYHNHFKRIGNMFKEKDSYLSIEVYNLATEIKKLLKTFEV